MRGQGAGAVRVRRYERLLWRLVVAAYLLGAAMGFLYAVLFFAVYPQELGPARIPLTLSILVPGLLLGTFVGRVQGGRRVRSATRWLTEERAPTDEEREALFSLPSRLATIGLGYWMALVVISWPYAVFVLDLTPGAIARSVFVSVPLVVIPWSLSFLFVERALGEIFAEAVTEDAPMPRTMRIPTRLILAWAATSGLPILGIVVSVVGQDPERLPLVVPSLLAICGAGTVGGIAVAVFSGWAITGPLAKVRAALRAIGGGDLEVRIPVSESAELGELEAGVNQMVADLQERERVREIFGHHVGLEVADRAIRSGTALGGEVVEATAMFVDIVGSSALAEERPPEEVVELLNAFFEAVVHRVVAEGGYVSRFEGDGALCLFGVLTTHEDHAERAMRAATGVRAALLSMSEGIDAAIGVSSGKVVAGNVGAADRYEFTIIGDAVNEASRLIEEAKGRPGRILVSERTVERAGRRAPGWRRAGRVSLRGRAEETMVFEPERAIEAGRSRGTDPLS